MEVHGSKRKDVRWNIVDAHDDAKWKPVEVNECKHRSSEASMELPMEASTTRSNPSNVRGSDGSTRWTHATIEV